MDVTKPYEFIGFGAMDVTKPYEFIRFGAMDVTKPYEFLGFGAMDVTKPYDRLSGPLAFSDSKILPLGLGPETFRIRPRRAGFQPSGPGKTFVFL